MSGQNNDKPGDLTALRGRIDELDQKIVELLNARARVVVDIGKAKQADGTPIYSPDREQAVLDRVTKLNGGPLPQDSLRAIYRELMSGSFALEKPLRVGYLGPEGSHSHYAAQRKFGASVEYLGLADIRAVFEEVARGHCDVGLVPIENSIGGGIIDTMDCFIGANVHICAEVLVAIHQNLLANCPPEKITTIASRPDVFAQCRNWLSATFKQAELLAVASSAKAAEMAAQRDGLAAIGSVLAAELYALKIVFANIEDEPSNMTRFFVISRTPAKRTGNDKTAIMFTTAHRAGALVDVLNVLYKYGINLTNIDTRPSKRRNWEYYFFVDAEGHASDETFQNALNEARNHCGELHVLGSFPRAGDPVQKAAARRFWMSRKLFIAGNWKMNLSRQEAAQLTSGLIAGIGAVSAVDMAVFPPFVYLPTVAEALSGSRIAWGAQNMWHEDNGAFTGEVSGSMLKDLGCRYVILGHSERRHVIGEGDELINRKVVKALSIGLSPILCVGELLEERDAGQTMDVVERQVTVGLEGVPRHDAQRVTIAYEPVWAIGTGRTAEPQQAQEVHMMIRRLIGRMYDAGLAETVRIQYGGSVKSKNAGELLAQPDIDGALVGGASLNLADFIGIVEAGVKVKR